MRRCLRAGDIGLLSAVAGAGAEAERGFPQGFAATIPDIQDWDPGGDKRKQSKPNGCLSLVSATRQFKTMKGKWFLRERAGTSCQVMSCLSPVACWSSTSPGAA